MDGVRPMSNMFLIVGDVQFASYPGVRMFRTNVSVFHAHTASSNMSIEHELEHLYWSMRRPRLAACSEPFDGA